MVIVAHAVHHVSARAHGMQLLDNCLNSTGGQAGHCISLVKVLNNALHNVHRICPEEVSQSCLRDVARRHA